MKIQRFKRLLCLGLVSSLTLSSLIGCGNNKQNVVFSNEQTKIQFSWWGNDVRHVYTMDGVDLFQDRNPNIEVAYRYGEWNGFEKRNKVWMESGSEADVMQINFAWISQYSSDGTGYYDLYELSDVIDLSNFTEADLALGEVNGHLNAIPIAYNTTMIAHNQDVYAAYGLSIPESWEDYFEAAKVMKDDGVYPIGAVKKQVFLLLMAYYEQKYGHPFFKADGSLAASKVEIEDLMEFYCRLLRENVLIPIDQFKQELFMTGQVATCAFWISDTGNYCGKAEERGRDIKLDDFPKMEAAKNSGRYIKPATLYAISNNTENPREAGILLNYLLNSTEMAEFQGTEKGVPISRSAYSYLDEMGELDSWQTKATEMMRADMEEMSVIIPMMENESIIDIFKSSADEYYYDKLSLSEAAQLVYDGINEI